MLISIAAVRTNMILYTHTHVMTEDIKGATQSPCNAWNGRFSLIPTYILRHMGTFAGSVSLIILIYGSFFFSTLTHIHIYYMFSRQPNNNNNNMGEPNAYLRISLNPMLIL